MQFCRDSKERQIVIFCLSYSNPMNVNNRKWRNWHLPQAGSKTNVLCNVFNSLDVMKSALVFLNGFYGNLCSFSPLFVMTSWSKNKQLPSSTDINLSCLVNVVSPCFKKSLTLQLYSCSPFFCFLSPHMCHQHCSHDILNLFYLFILYYTDDLFSGLILWVFCCCYWCYYFMSRGVHVAKNYTNYILMVRFSSSLLLCEFSRYLILSLVVDMSIHCSISEQKNIEFLPKSGAKLHCTLDILMREIIQKYNSKWVFCPV